MTDGRRRDRAVEAMMAVSRTMTAIVARTLGEVAGEITVPQLRVMVLLSSGGSMNLSAIAQHLAVNRSNASRTCDQLVLGGRVARAEDPRDRRNVTLSLTADGEDFVARLMEARRRLLEPVVHRMSEADRDRLARGLEAFSAAVAEMPAEETVGLPDGRIIPWLM